MSPPLACVHGRCCVSGHMEDCENGGIALGPLLAMAQWDRNVDSLASLQVPHHNAGMNHHESNANLAWPLQS